MEFQPFVTYEEVVCSKVGNSKLELFHVIPDAQSEEYVIGYGPILV